MATGTPSDREPCCNSYQVTVSLHDISKADALALADYIEFLMDGTLADTTTTYTMTTSHVKDVR